ncbi:MAG: glycoside hydrolase family 65 protein [Thermomicrobiales bacterium]
MPLITSTPAPDGRDEAWRISYDHYAPDEERRREALLSLGNGYFVTRGAAPEATASEHHYPGTYIAGIYNRATAEIAGETSSFETIVNAPNWLPLCFRHDDGAWFRLNDVTILAYQQTLDLQTGILSRELRFADDQGRRTKLSERRFVHMRFDHLAGLQTEIVAENWSGRLIVRSAIDGTVKNCLAEGQAGSGTRHLKPIDQSAVGDNILWLKAQTRQSRVEIDVAVRTGIWLEGERRDATRSIDDRAGYIGQQQSFDLGQGQALRIEKIAAIYTSRDNAISESGEAARQALRQAPDFDDVLPSHARAWSQLWRRSTLSLGDDLSDTERILRLHLFHVQQTASPNTIGHDAGVPARGWSGEAYYGHVFWDELLVLLYLHHHDPDVSHSLLLYRFRRLDAARDNARRAGYHGAMFPWRSASTGQEETPPAYRNTRNGGWIRDHTPLERHITGAIAYNTWQYYETTGDLDFLNRYGAEMLIEIARFWASIATFNIDHQRYEIHGVMGPDEFHSGYPDAPEPGLSNNTYTNILAVWCLCRALDVWDRLPSWRRDELTLALDLEPDEFDEWERISRRMRIVSFGDGILAQFEGYDSLEDLDWDAYRQRYGDIERLDLILDAEGDTPNRYKLSKQPDVLMLFFLFSAEDLGALFARLGYPFDREMMRRNVEYYLERSSRGSTLSRVVYAWVIARFDQARSWEWFCEALRSDVDDIQGGTTPEGIHLGAMAGTVDVIERCYGGLEIRGDALRFDPALPAALPRLAIRLLYRGCWLDVTLTHDHIAIKASPDAPTGVTIHIGTQTDLLAPGGTLERQWNQRDSHES